MIKVKNANFNYAVIYCNSIKEIDKTILEDITKNIEVDKNHCVVALCSQVNIGKLTLINFDYKQLITRVVPIIAKLGNNKDYNNINLNIGDVILTNDFELERALIINNKHPFTVNKIKDYFSNIKNKNSDLSISFLPYRELNNNINYNDVNIVSIELVILPLIAIKGVINDNYIEKYIEQDIKN